MNIKIENALSEFLTVWNDSWLAGMVGPTLTCTEADALIDLFAAFSGTDEGSVAEMWLHGHARSDDEGDEHWETRLWLEDEPDTADAKGGE